MASPSGSPPASPLNARLLAVAGMRPAYDWPVWLFWLLIAVMLALAVLNTAVRKIGDEHTLRRAAAIPRSRPPRNSARPAAGRTPRP